MVEQLSVIIEEYETANEALRTSNEELQVMNKMNEELNSANQELEASKEELHAMNDEQEAANDELKSKNDALVQANSDLRNLIASIEIGIIFLDRELRLKRYTPRMEPLFNIVPADQGQPLDDLTSKISYPAEESLAADVRHVLDTLEEIKREVHSQDDRWYLVRLLPYRTMEDRIDGVVITFLDITERKQHLDEIAKRERQQAIVAELGRHALQEGDLQNLMNRVAREVAHTLDVEFCKILEYRPDRRDLLLKAGVGWKEGCVGKYTEGAGTESQAGYTLKANRPVMMENLAKEKRFEQSPLLVEHSVTSGVTVVIPAPDHPYGVVGAHTRDQRRFTEQDAAFLQAVANVLGAAVERRNAEEALRRSEEQYRRIVENVEEYAIFMLDKKGKVATWNAGAGRILGYDADEIIGAPFATIFPEEDRIANVPEEKLERAEAEGRTFDEGWRVRKEGSRFWARGVLTALYDTDGELLGFTKILRDNTERREQEKALRESRERLQEFNETLEERVEARTEQVRKLSAALAQAEQKERERVSQILHDHLQQQLQAMQIWVSALRDDPAPEKREELIDDVYQTLKEANDTARTLTVELTPPVLKGPSLAPALKWLAIHMDETYDLTVDLDCPRSFQAPSEELALLLFQVSREILFNIVKHAEVERAEVRCAKRDGRVCIEIEDEGVGFDPESLDNKRANGFGLFSIRDRLDLIGGQLRIESAPGRGTCMTVIAPTG